LPGAENNGKEVRPQVKNPVLAAVLSFFIPGLGQIYNGQTKKGLIFLGVDLLDTILTPFGIGIITGLAVAVYAAWDAYKNAEEINRRAEGQ
jgi:TM2 domain-containing membrane protein YozV